ncbi:hypothetical protein SASPL_150556 [Salvia splendens]|uniref:beta-ketoacyl-[acyl-carrier-protein] synthase I n=1 Tax=Salvia splendens TaxID=180675 RepID=A0A8X8Z1V0_SALSN|nr:hypothetical protein SASPL_150556 [Salvia splendens]
MRGSAFSLPSIPFSVGGGRISMASSSVMCSWLMPPCMSNGESSSRRRHRRRAKCVPNLVNSSLSPWINLSSVSNRGMLRCSAAAGNCSASPPIPTGGSHYGVVVALTSLIEVMPTYSLCLECEILGFVVGGCGEMMEVAVSPAMEISSKMKPPTKAKTSGRDSGISEIEAFDCSQFPTRIAGEIKSFSTDGWVVPKLSKRMDRFMLYMLTAGKKALADGGITEDLMDELNKAKCGVLIGSAMGGMQVFYDAIEALRISYRKMNPFCVPFATTNMGSAMLAMDLGWMGPNYSISTACATSNFCILNAANHIIRGEADMMLCGGSDAAIIPIENLVQAWEALLHAERYRKETVIQLKPHVLGISRDGFVMGEGAGVLLLEELEHAKSRGATIYAEFLGGSFTSDAYHMTEPHPQGTGVILCVEKALAQSGVSKEDVNYINAHATSTPAGDLKEYQALIHCFGQNPELKVNSTKSMIGHLLGAAGAVEAVATVQVLKIITLIDNGFNYLNGEHIVSSVEIDRGDANVLVGPTKERLDIKVALSNSFGFGGHNSSILFAPYK